MAQLLLTLLSIALTGAAIYASISYTPIWQNGANDTFAVAKAGFSALEVAYMAATKANSGTPPAVNTGATDGGLSANFSAYYGFLPKAPRGYSWKYGINSGTNYFCLFSTTGSNVASEGTWRGLTRIRNVLSDDQFFIVQGGSGACDAPLPATPQSTAAKAPPSGYPALLAAVYLVKYLPGP